MNAYLAETYTVGHIADLHREAAAARLAAGLPRAAGPHRWAELRTRFAAWAERPRAGRSLGVCCPA
jgi:hypothetical protein